MTDAEALAHHEAAHAVAAVVLDVPFEAVQLGARTGELRLLGNWREWSRERHRRTAVVALAGAWGESIARRRPCRWPTADQALADQYLSTHAGTPQELAADARELVAAHWPEVCTVAAALCRLRRLDCAEVRRLTGRIS